MPTMAVSDPQTTSSEDCWTVHYRKESNITLSGATEYGSRRAAAEVADNMEDRESVKEAWPAKAPRRRISARW